MKDTISLFVKSRFFKTFSIIKNNKKDSGIIILLDALFFVALIFLSKIVTVVLEQNYTAITSLRGSIVYSSAFMLSFTLVYFAAVLFVYSLFNILIINTVLKMTGKEELGYLLFWRMAGMNALLYGCFFIALVIAGSAINLSVKEEYINAVRGMFALVLLAVLYVIVMASNVLFSKGFGLKKVLKGSVFFVAEFKKYLPVFGFSAVIFMLFYSVYYVVWLFIAFFANYAHTSYLAVSAYVAMGVIYLVFVFFNRLYFFEVMDKSHQK